MLHLLSILLIIFVWIKNILRTAESFEPSWMRIKFNEYELVMQFIGTLNAISLMKKKISTHLVYQVVGSQQ